MVVWLGEKAQQLQRFLLGGRKRPDEWDLEGIPRREKAVLTAESGGPGVGTVGSRSLGEEKSGDFGVVEGMDCSGVARSLTISFPLSFHPSLMMPYVKCLGSFFPFFFLSFGVTRLSWVLAFCVISWAARRRTSQLMYLGMDHEGLICIFFLAGSCGMSRLCKRWLLMPIQYTS
jgi:hypothetical protein